MLSNNYIRKEKEVFVERLSDLICSKDDNHYKNMYYEADYNPVSDELIEERVIVICDNNYKYSIDITADSCIAIMKDVACFLLNH